MSKKHYYGTLAMITAVFLLLFLLVSCVDKAEPEPVPISFEELCLLSPENLATMKGDAVPEWVESNFGAPPSISTGDNDSVVVVFSGSSARLGDFVGNILVREGRINEVSLHDIQTGPHFDEVVMGLGDPTSVNHYCAMPHEPQWVTIGLDYPAVGVSVYASESHSRGSLAFEGGLGIVLNEESQVTLIQCYPPAPTMEEIINRDSSLTPTGRRLQLENRASWTGFGSIVRLTEP
ncbi:MAG: hypothetical protein JW892_03465 [Anaerolineae bacterium]|nr:hypothetical protein [Anaerolineae bacterium]